MFSLLLQSLFKNFSLIHLNIKSGSPFPLTSLSICTTFSITTFTPISIKVKKKKLVVEGTLCWYVPLHTILPTFLYLHRFIVLMNVFSLNPMSCDVLCIWDLQGMLWNIMFLPCFIDILQLGSSRLGLSSSPAEYKINIWEEQLKVMELSMTGYLLSHNNTTRESFPAMSWLP